MKRILLLGLSALILMTLAACTRETDVEVIQPEFRVNGGLLEYRSGDMPWISLIDTTGFEGSDGRDGVNGQDGVDGVSIADASINDEGNLLLTLSNGNVLNAGTVVSVGPGQDAPDEAPGFVLEETYVNDDGELVIVAVDGTELNAGNVVGPEGPRGATGSSGSAGEDGEDGAPGAPGPAGSPGTDGDEGDQGPQGDPGEDAEVITTASNASEFQTLTEYAAVDTILFTQDIVFDDNLTTDLVLTFDELKAKGNLSFVTDGALHITLTGSGVLDGSLEVDLVNGDFTLGQGLTVTGVTTISAVDTTSFETSANHQGGINIEGPGRINALNETVKPVIRVKTTAAIIIDGFVETLELEVADTSITLNAVTSELNLNDHSSSITFGENNRSAINNLVINDTEDTYFNTIQGAINAASDGDTILVQPGIYTESFTIANDDLTLKSSVRHEAKIDGSLTVNASGVAVDSFFITPQDDRDFDTERTAIRVYGNDVTIENNRIGNFDYTLPGDGSQRSGAGGISGIHVYNSDEDNPLYNITIQNNTISDIEFKENTSPVSPAGWAVSYGEIYGIHVQGNITGISISGNMIDNLSSAAFVRGIAFGQTNSISASNRSIDTLNPRDISVTNNTLSALKASMDGSPSYQITIGSYVSKASIQSISNNAFKVNLTEGYQSEFIHHASLNPISMSNVFNANEFYESDTLLDSSGVVILESINLSTSALPSIYPLGLVEANGQTTLDFINTQTTESAFIAAVNSVSFYPNYKSFGDRIDESIIIDGRLEAPLKDMHATLISSGAFKSVADFEEAFQTALAFREATEATMAYVSNNSQSSISVTASNAFLLDDFFDTLATDTALTHVSGPLSMENQRKIYGFLITELGNTTSSAVSGGAANADSKENEEIELSVFYEENPDESSNARIHGPTDSFSSLMNFLSDKVFGFTGNKDQFEQFIITNASAIFD